MDIMTNYAELQTRQELADFNLKITRNSADWKMIWEWHEQIELMFILSGKGRKYIEDKSYEFRSGDLFVIPPYKLHRSELTDETGFEALIIIFRPSLREKFCLVDEEEGIEHILNSYADYSPHLRFSEDRLPRIEIPMRAMAEEFVRAQGCSQRYLLASLQILLIEINRVYDEQVTANRATQAERVHFSPIITEIIGYIYEHYRDDLTLAELARLFQINPSYLSRQFKKNTGLTLSAYITGHRITIAKNLLVTTEMNVTEVAFGVGFNNISYFNWVFKNIVGMTPKVFRKESIAGRLMAK
ncbi:helix-turn-helix transcriptional regulator [Paenibacillus sp. HN-1]|uniref:helix-turn-helix transcriptional regulator n=2 Tax=Paenibacillus TaxID=44249 RepID=UPI001CA8CD0C|nr:AraC family transcriptional regulator [Paenibacillus sinensis]MBY9087913.1 helix-turn-helix transcriptional regulator [Paenibacillus sinensis]